MKTIEKTQKQLTEQSCPIIAGGNHRETKQTKNKTKKQIWGLDYVLDKQPSLKHLRFCCFLNGFHTFFSNCVVFGLFSFVFFPMVFEACVPNLET